MSKHRPLPSQAELQHLFNYDPETGLFTWKNPRARCLKPGDKAGCVLADGYIVITVSRKNYKAHRLAWMFVYGDDPGEFEIDHIDRNRSNNRISNLRIVSSSHNHYNTSAKGFSFRKQIGKFEVQIKDETGRHFLGFYDTEAEARQAYLDAKEQLHIIPA